jgi:type IX secretion system PorP/SprF family membrane protein
MKHFIIHIFILCSATQFSFAQQLQTSSMYDMQGSLHNPAMAGINGYGSIGATYRSMWDGIDGGPQTGTLFGSAYLPGARIGLGGYIYSDKTGPTKRTGLQMAYAYHVPLNNESKLSIGLEARMQQFSMDKAKLQESLGGSDPVLNSSENRFKFDAGFGLAWSGKTFQAGISVSQLIQSKLEFYNTNLGTGTSPLQDRNEEGRLYRHYYFHSNYKWRVDGNTVIIPNILFIYLPNAPLELQGGARVEHKEVFFWGASLRARQSWMLSAGVHIKKKFTVGYSFDLYNTPLSTFEKGASAHEVLLRYDFLKN